MEAFLFGLLIVAVVLFLIVLFGRLFFIWFSFDIERQRTENAEKYKDKDEQIPPYCPSAKRTHVSVDLDLITPLTFVKNDNARYRCSRCGQVGKP